MFSPSSSHAYDSDEDTPEVPFFELYGKHLKDDSTLDEDDTREPFENMEFMEIQDAYEFYNSYAGRTGFSIRKHTHYLSKCTGLPTYIKWVCSNEGIALREKKRQKMLGELSGQRTPTKDRTSTRCDCKAFMSINYSNKDEKWIVSKFNKEHTHELIVSPSKKRLLQSQKYMSEEQKELIRLLGSHGVKPIQIYEILAEMAGGRQNLCFTRKDVSNVIVGENRKIIGVDLDSTMIYLNKLPQSDPDFFFIVDTEKDNTVKNLFWVDGRSRMSYHEFGDVVVFDNTYATNKYSMPCAPFVGVNHHRQSIFFGCALIRDEKMSTFEWLFETWLKAMHGKHPKSIITDQCPSMKGAIAKIFPSTVHRCCQWHVMRKAREHLGILYDQRKNFKNDLFGCINQSLTVQEFEKNWANMLHTHKLEENRHLNVMFEAAKFWVPAYFRGTFFADMSTSQRSESMNSAMKKWLHSRTSICNFVIQFEKITAGIFDKESEEDIRTTNCKSNLWTDDKIEEQAREVYTKNVFILFRDILNRATGFTIEALEHDKLYLIKSQKYNASYKVKVDKPNFIVSCECKGFEFEGLLCSHALKVMQSIGMNLLPSHYILKRWTKNANMDVKYPVCAKNIEIGDGLLTRRLATLTAKFKKICIKASKNDDAYNMVCAKLDELADEIGEGEEGDESLCEPLEPKKTQSLFDPPVSQCKGMKKPSRLKPSAEIGKKGRTCSICKKKVGHNAKTCPEKMKLKRKDGTCDNGGDEHVITMEVMTMTMKAMILRMEAMVLRVI